MQIVQIIKSMRPNQCTKNLFVFAALLFSRNLFNLPLLLTTSLAFFIFCLLSGCVYIVNDLVDLESDKRHPLKSQRPLASGKLKFSEAVGALIILVPVSLGFSFHMGTPFFLTALGYLFLQLAYSFLLKHLIILDVLSVACGFVLRVAAGAVVIQVEISPWLLICTILLALFLAFSKRRHELVLLEEGAQDHRKILKEYSPYLLDQMISVVTASTVMAYALYTMSGETIRKFGTKNLIFTIPFVLYGIFRYLYLIHQKKAGGNPESIVLTDRPLIIAIILWIIAVALILYKK
jgi:4-hydroxybenzoate polyprenyltransferase